MVLSLGGVVVGNTIKNQISYSQGSGSIVIGHNDVLNHYSMRYGEFTNDFVVFNNTENLIQQEYLFNSSIIDDLENNTYNNYETVGFWDRRLFVYADAKEVDGLIINFQGNISDSSSYTVIGQDRIGTIPIVGIEFKSYIDDWKYFGTLENGSKSAIIGDTLARNFFDYAIKQSIDIYGIGTSRYNVTGVLYDSFCRGNATYVRLESLQNDLALNGMINLVVLGINPETDKTTLINNIKLDLLSSGLGEEFSVIDLTKSCISR
jgi:hypothetical protein